MSHSFKNKLTVDNSQGIRLWKFLKNNPPQAPPAPPPTAQYKYNTMLIVCDQLINFKNIPENILRIMPGYQAFKSIGIQFDNIYNNRQDCSPSRGSFASSQLNINISDNIDQTFQADYNPQLNTSFDTIGKSLKRNGFETVWYGKNHFVSAISTDINAVPEFNTNTRYCLKEYGYDIYNTYGDTYYYSNQGMFSDNTIFNFKINDSNSNVDFVDSSGKYIGAIPYLKARVANDKAFHLELHLENPHDTQHFWQNFAQKPTKSQLQFWSPYINEQIALLKSIYPDSDIYNPYNFSDTFTDAWIQNPNLIKNYFENTFFRYINDKSSMPFKESYMADYVLDPSNNSAFPYYIGVMQSLSSSSTIPANQDDIMSWKNLINNYYGLVLEIDNYIYQVYLLLKTSGMLNTTAVTIISDHGDMMSSHGLKQKGFPFENSCNISCLIYSPHIKDSLKGTSSAVLGSLLDIAPTIESLANIRQTKSTRFLGKSLLNWDVNKLVVRNDNVPVFNIYNSWMTYLTYFQYRYWEMDNSSNTVISDFNPSNFYEYQSFFTMIVDNINGQKYKLARYFNFIELMEYNWLFDSSLNSLQIDATIIKNSFSDELTKMSLFDDDTIYSMNLIDSFFETNTWDFKNFYEFIISETTRKDNVYVLLIMISLINITISNIGFSYIIPGYYDDNYTIYNKFIDYYDDPDHHYYFFMYNITDDPNETTNLLDKAYPERQTPDVMANATLLNNRMNLLIDKYKIHHFDFIVPIQVFISLAINLKINKDKITSLNVADYENCFGLNKSDGDLITQSYYNDIIRILQKI